MHRPFWGLLGGDLGKTRCSAASSRWCEACWPVLKVSIRIPPVVVAWVQRYGGPRSNYMGVIRYVDMCSSDHLLCNTYIHSGRQKAVRRGVDRRVVSCHRPARRRDAPDHYDVAARSSKLENHILPSSSFMNLLMHLRATYRARKLN